MKETVDLGGGYVLFQPEGVYPCGSDAVLLSAFAAEHGEGGRFCDLCCGSGVVAVLVCKRRSDVAFRAVDISKKACETAAKNAEVNGLSDRISVTECDVREVDKLLEKVSFNCVTVNPPYMKASSGRRPADELTRIAVQETLCTAADVIKASAYLLRAGGGLFLVQRYERMEELLSLMRESGLCPKLIRPVLYEAGADAKIFLAMAVKGGSGEPEEKPLILRENGAFTAEAARIYGE